MPVNLRIKNDIPNMRISNVIPNARVSTFQTSISNSILAGTPIGLLLSLTYNKQINTQIILGDFRPTMRIKSD